MEPIALPSRKKVFLTDLLHFAIFTIVFGSAMFLFLDKPANAPVVPYQEDRFYLHHLLLIYPILFLGVLAIIIKRNFVLGVVLLLRVLQLFFITISLYLIFIGWPDGGISIFTPHFLVCIILSYFIYVFLLSSGAEPLKQKNKLLMIILCSLTSFVIFYLLLQVIISSINLNSYTTELPDLK